MSDLRALILLIAAVCVGALDIRPAFAQDVGAVPAHGGGHFGDIADPSQWPISSVGTVTVLWHTNIITQCTGTLVGPKLVLSAAHCLYLGNQMATPRSVHFSAGLNKGAAAAHSVAASLEVSRDYDPQLEGQIAGADADWAIVTLTDALTSRPVRVRALSAEEFRAVAAANSAMQVGYGRDRPYLPSAYPPARMKPVPEKATDGRVNPRGIACLYLASHKETAALEVRPLIGSYVSMGQFEVLRDNPCGGLLTRQHGRMFFLVPSPSMLARGIRLESGSRG